MSETYYFLITKIWWEVCRKKLTSLLERIKTHWTRNFCTWNIEVLSWKITRKKQCPVQVVLKNDYEIFCHTYYFNMNIHLLCCNSDIVSYLLKFNFIYVIHSVLILMTVMEAIYRTKIIFHLKFSNTYTHTAQHTHTHTHIHTHIHTHSHTHKYLG